MNYNIIETIIMIVLPFTNEFASILEESHIKCFDGLYASIPNNNKQKIIKLLIDMISYIGIIVNTSVSTNEYGKIPGILKGFGVLVISFFIPNLSFHYLIDHICNSSDSKKRLMFGLILIGILIAFEFAYIEILKIYIKKNY
jgi:hypothetical protein